MSVIKMFVKREQNQSLPCILIEFTITIEWAESIIIANIQSFFYIAGVEKFLITLMQSPLSPVVLLLLVTPMKWKAPSWLVPTFCTESEHDLHSCQIVRVIPEQRCDAWPPLETLPKRLLNDHFDAESSFCIETTSRHGPRIHAGNPSSLLLIGRLKIKFSKSGQAKRRTKQ